MSKIFGWETKDSSHYRIYFLGFKFNIMKPHLKNMSVDYSIYKNPAEIPPAEGVLREIQLANLSVLKIFDSFCKRKNLTYWLDFGTLLGAVRHKGFIPWDDDLDIGMPREDYERMIDEIEKDRHLYVEFESNGRSKCYAKVKHILTKDIFIDVFPYDYYCGKTDANEKKKLHKKITGIITGLKFTPFSINNQSRLRRKLAKITNEKILQNKPATEDTIFWGIDFPHARWKNRVYDTTGILPVKNMKFEDYEFPCPADSDYVLKNVYGNYMQVPKNTYPKHANLTGIDAERQERLQKLIKAGETCEES